MLPFSSLLGVAFVIGSTSGDAMGSEIIAHLPAHTKVLFQGDSITDMARGRTPDPNHILGHSYVFILSSKAAATYPQDQVEFINRGVSGNTVTDLEARWKQDALDLKPDVLSILIGINDLGSGVSPDDFEKNYDRLLTTTITALPTVKLVLCEPFGLPTGGQKGAWEKFKTDLGVRQAILARLASKYHAILVRLQPVFDAACERAPAEHWIWDGIHPTYAGHQLIADEWAKTVNNALVSPLLDPSRNTAISPQVNFERDSYDWLHRHADVLDTQAKGNPDLVMIGDSITHFWGGEPKSPQSNGPKSWEATFRGVKVLNMGFGWDRTQNVLWRLQHGEFEGLKPKAIVLNIGTNNLVGDNTARTNTPEETAIGIQAIISALHERSPDSHIFVMGVFPRGFDKGNDLDRRVTELNALITRAFTGASNVTVLNIGDRFREPDGNILPSILSDGTHPTDKGYTIWGRALIEAGAVPGRR